MPLQIGTWTMNVGGNVTQLQVTSVDPQGNVVATIGTNQSLAVWDEDSQKLMLLCFGQFFVGYLFTDTVNLTGVTGTVLFTLAGSAESFQPNPRQIGQATAKRATLGMVRADRRGLKFRAQAYCSSDRQWRKPLSKHFCFRQPKWCRYFPT